MSDQTTIRVKKATLARMRAEIDRLADRAARGLDNDLPVNLEPINPSAQPLSPDWLINHLMSMAEDHRERSRSSSKRRTARRAAAAGDDAQAVSPPEA